MKEKIKVIILPTVLILISIGIGFGVLWYFLHQEAVKECKTKCRYDDKLWEYSYSSNWGKVNPRRFPTQEQCIDYCLIVK